MNVSEAKVIHGPEAVTAARELAGGSVAEVITSISAIVLAVIALAGVLSFQLAAITTIILGASFLVEGWVVSSAHRVSTSSQAGAFAHTGGFAGISAQGLGGLAGVVLGILALFRTGSEMLIATALLVFGATLLLRTWASFYPSYWLATPSQMSGAETFPHMSANGLSGQVLVGVGATVLGILAIIGEAPLTLSLAGLLSVGAALLLGGSVGQSSAAYAP
jgi:hypothetical protein